MTDLYSRIRPERRAWLPVLLAGLGLWVLTVVVTFITRNVHLVPTLILLGSFLVPVTFAVWIYGRRGPNVSVELLFSAFVIGGLIGVLGAAVLESYLLRPSVLLFAGVGLIEEGVKLLALVLIAIRMPHRTARDGLVLGGAVGFGFAAFESAGYAFTALFTVTGLSLEHLVETEALRGLVAPFGHGLWTAILGGVLFGASANRRLRITVPVILAYLGVAGLHALFDGMRVIAVVLTYVLTATPAEERLLARGFIPNPTEAEVHLSAALYIGGLVAVSVVGLAWLLSIARRARATTAAIDQQQAPASRADSR